MRWAMLCATSPHDDGPVPNQQWKLPEAVPAARYRRVIVPVSENVSSLGTGPPLLVPVTTTLAV